jgi:hypothetical protein
LLVDSTGLKLCGAGEWLIEKWHQEAPGLAEAASRCGRRDRPDRASALASKEIDDGVAVSALLDQVSGPLSSFTADRAYDQDAAYPAVTERLPEAAVIVPRRRRQVQCDMAAIAPTPRDRHLKSSVSPRRASELTETFGYQ